MVVAVIDGISPKLDILELLLLAGNQEREWEQHFGRLEEGESLGMLCPPDDLGTDASFEV